MLPKERSIDFYPRLMSAALIVCQMENEDVLNFLTAGTWLSYISFDDQKKINNIYIVNLKSTWEKHLLAAWAITDIGSQADISMYSWSTATMLYWGWLSASLLETSLDKSR